MFEKINVGIYMIGFEERLIIRNWEFVNNMIVCNERDWDWRYVIVWE